MTNKELRIMELIKGFIQDTYKVNFVSYCVIIDHVSITITFDSFIIKVAIDICDIRIEHINQIWENIQTEIDTNIVNAFKK